MSQVVRSPASTALASLDAGSVNFELGFSELVPQDGCTMNMNELLELPAAKLKRILTLKTIIERLQAELEKITVAGPSARGSNPARKGRKLSAAARKRISLAAKARWAKVRAAKAK